MFVNDRIKRTAPSRRALTVAGVATLVFSLVVSIGPALAAPGANGGNGGGGNAGTVKIHDATTNLEAGETGNEPWVCSFFIGFYTTGVAETGDWQVVSWPPTGDGTIILTGSYDTTGDGVDTTAVFGLAEGHYRLEWQAIADNNLKHKTFWVDCEEVVEQEESSPSPEPSPTQVESTPSDDPSPSQEESTPSDDESPSQEASPSADPSPSQEESTPSDDESPSEEASPSQEESTPSDDESPSQEASPSQEESTPSDGESPSADPSPSQDEEPSSPDPDQEPEGEVKAGNPDHGFGSGTGGHQAPAEGGVSALPDTATSTPVTESGVLATIGVLLILVAHAGTRRVRTLPSA